MTIYTVYDYGCLSLTIWLTPTPSPLTLPVPPSILSSLPAPLLLSYRSHGCRQRTVQCRGASRLGGHLAMGSGGLAEEEREEVTGKELG